MSEIEDLVIKVARAVTNYTDVQWMRLRPAPRTYWLSLVRDILSAASVPELLVEVEGARRVHTQDVAVENELRTQVERLRPQARALLIENERLRDAIKDSIPYLGERELCKPILRAALESTEEEI